MLSKVNEKTREKFIKEFVRELILIKSYELESQEVAKRESERIKLEIEAQKLRQKYLNQLKITELQTLEEKRKLEELRLKKLKEENVKKRTQLVQQGKKSEIIKIKSEPVAEIKQKQLPNVVEKRQILKPITPPLKILSTYKPVPILRKAPEASELNVNKIHIFISDLDIESIECPGKDKNVIIKKRGQTMRTEIRLKEEEINEIINEFSEKARIPVIEGLLRARVGSLQISAVVSKEVGSRFLIIRRVIPMIGSGFQPGKSMQAPLGHKPIIVSPTRDLNNKGLQGMRPSIMHR